jgi:hypothetical protein
VLSSEGLADPFRVAPLEVTDDAGEVVTLASEANAVVATPQTSAQPAASSVERRRRTPASPTISPA